jgi:hypothetical protein
MTATQRIVLLAVALLCWAAGCAAQAAEPDPVRVGDRWSYDLKDDLTGDLRHSITVVVVEVTDKEITTRTTVRGKDRPLTMIFGLDWGRIDDGAWKVNPSGLGIKMPLEVGKEWRSDANALHRQSGVAFRASGFAKVVKQEQVTTPAGTFDTYQVDTTTRLVNTQDQTKSSTWRFVYWYAPSVNRWVKRKTEQRFDGRLRDSHIEELTEYSRKP